MSRQPSPADREAAKLAQTVARRAIRRLDIFEWLVFAAMAGLALAGGAVVAWILPGVAGWDFRSTWIGASLVLFIVPGTIAIVKIRRDARTDAGRISATQDEDDG